jgi:phosphosulfolactate synthase
MQADLPFGFVPIDPRRSLSKPRRTGLSMVIDDGLPLSYARDVLDLAAPYIDLMKIKTGTARLYPRDALVRKLALYEELGVQPFLGGQFHEYVFAILGEVALPKFYAEARALGFRAIEISDNTVPLTPQQRRNQITAAIASGLTVFGKVGFEGNAQQSGIADRAGRVPSTQAPRWFSWKQPSWWKTAASGATVSN